MTDSLHSWSTTAVNLPEHASNIIHTDDGARAAGFAAALVAGVTTYAYLTHVPATAWGMQWLTSGGAAVRFREPVIDGDRVDCVVGDNGRVDACVDGAVCAEASFTETSIDLPERDGPALRPITFTLDSTWSDYGMRGGDSHRVYVDDNIAHPTSWPRIANEFFHEQLVSGPWIHVRSVIQHLGVARVGASITATAAIADRFESRAGERAILDVRISADGQPVAALEHEAIIELAAP